MNIEQLEKELAEMQENMDNIRNLIEEERNKPVIVDGVYVTAPTDGTIYFTILAANGRVGSSKWTTGTGHDVDLTRLDQGNCFVTREVAELERDRRLIMQTMRKCGGHRKNKNKVEDFTIRTDVRNNLYADWLPTTQCNSSLPIWFDTKEQAQACLDRLIEEYGEDRLKEVL